jgi:hypothetical protein
MKRYNWIGRDIIGNKRHVEVIYDGGEYIGSIRGGTPVKMASGKLVQPVVATGKGKSLFFAASDTLVKFDSYQRRQRSS